VAQDKARGLLLIAYQMAVFVVCLTMVACKSGMNRHRSTSPFQDLILRTVVETNSTGEVQFHLFVHNDSAETVVLPPALFMHMRSTDLFVRRYVSSNGIVFVSNPYNLTWEIIASGLITFPRTMEGMPRARESVLPQSDLKIATYGSHELDGDGEYDFWADMLLPNSVWMPGDLWENEEKTQCITLRSNHIRWLKQHDKVVWRTQDKDNEVTRGRTLETRNAHNPQYLQTFPLP
jgi:hypothetical protein